MWHSRFLHSHWLWHCHSGCCSLFVTVVVTVVVVVVMVLSFRFNDSVVAVVVIDCVPWMM